MRMRDEPVGCKEIRGFDHQEPLIVEVLELRHEGMMADELDAGLVSLVFDDVDDTSLSLLLGGVV